MSQIFFLLTTEILYTVTSHTCKPGLYVVVSVILSKNTRFTNQNRIHACSLHQLENTTGTEPPTLPSDWFEKPWLFWREGSFTTVNKQYVSQGFHSFYETSCYF